MMSEVETPFPVEGTLTATESGYTLDLPCATEWLTETETGDYVDKAVQRIALEYGEGIGVRVRWTDDGHGVCNSFELLGGIPMTDESERESRQRKVGQLYDLLHELAREHEADNAELRQTDSGREIALQFDIPELAGGNDDA
jgi:hypothetical protein